MATPYYFYIRIRAILYIFYFISTNETRYLVTNLSTLSNYVQIFANRRSIKILSLKIVESLMYTEENINIFNALIDDQLRPRSPRSAIRRHIFVANARMTRNKNLMKDKNFIGRTCIM